MLLSLSEESRECRRYAKDCAQKAAAQTDTKLKQDFLTLEQSWLSLARSYELTDRLRDFSTEAMRQADKSV